MEAVQDLGLFCERFGITIPEGAEEKLARFSQRLAEANTIMNLTRVTDPAGIASRHLADSLVFLACLEGRESVRLLDVGTGAGLPAIPLAVTRPTWSITAVDSTAKKIAFVRAICDELGLESLRPLAERVEALAHQREHRERYQAVVARAVARLPVLLEYTIPFLEPGGLLFAPKGSRAEEEILSASRAFEELGCALVAQEEYPTLDPDTEYRLLVIEKLRRTDATYPRHPSRIRSNPLDPQEV